MNNNSEPKLRSYVIGFVLSLVFTLAAYFLVLAHISSAHETISHEVLISLILVLAVIQLIIQLYFFLHLGREEGPRWKLGAFISTIGIILIVIVGSIWIMAHLNYNMMASPTDMDHYIQSQDGF